MALLDELTSGVVLKGLLPHGLVTVVNVTRHGSIGAEIIYKDANGHLGSELLYQDNIASLHVVKTGLSWSFEADGAMFRLTSEAYRIHLAYLFDPLIAVHTSLVEPLPHQITCPFLQRTPNMWRESFGWKNGVGVWELCRAWSASSASCAFSRTPFI